MINYRSINNDNSILIHKFINEKNVKEYILPSFINDKKVTDIGVASFADEKQLRRVSFSPYISEVGRAAFKNSNVVEYIYNSNLREIRDEAFANNYMMKNNNLQDTNVITMGSRVYKSCVLLKRAVLPFLLQDIGTGTFMDCESLEYADVSSLFIIPSKTFYMCVSLEVAKINDMLQKIGNECFRKNIHLKSFPILYFLYSIGAYAFAESGLIEFKGTESLHYIGKGCFSDNINIEIIDLLITKIKKLEPMLVHGCTSLKQMILPSDLVEISDYVFGGCVSLKEIFIPPSVEKISSKAFFTKIYDDKEKLISEKPIDITIICERGSAAEIFAKNNNIKYVYEGE